MKSLPIALFTPTDCSYLSSYFWSLQLSTGPCWNKPPTIVHLDKDRQGCPCGDQAGRRALQGRKIRKMEDPSCKRRAKDTSWTIEPITFALMICTRRRGQSCDARDQTRAGYTSINLGFGQIECLATMD